jgi:hypothetical protein
LIQKITVDDEAKVATTGSSTSKLAAIFGFAKRRDPSQRSLGHVAMADNGNVEEVWE